MGSPTARRADTAGRASKRCLRALFPFICLLLLAPAARGADSAPADAAAADPLARSVGEVTVTATRAERDVLEVPGNVTVIDRAEIERSGARSLPDLLRRQSGLFVTNSTTNPAGASVDARGFNNGGDNGGNLLLQVDGRRTNEADSGVPDWALLPLDMIERIEIVRGSTSTMYGDNAAGGVVNIRTRPQEGSPRGSVRGFFGRHDTGGGSLVAAATVGRATGSLFIGGMTSDGYRDNSGFDDQNYNGTFEWNFGDRVLVGVRGSYHEDTREFPGGLTRQMKTLFGRNAANPTTSATDNDSDVERGYVQGWVEAILADQIELRVRPFYRDRNDDATIVASFFGLTTTTHIDADKLGGGVDTQLQIDRPLSGLENRLIVGFEYLHEEVERDVEDPFFPNVSDNERDVYGVFLQEELHLTEDLLVAAGFRFDRALLDLDVVRPLAGTRSSANPRYSEWSPKASITWRALPSLALYGSYARGFRLPTLDEASPLFGDIPDLDAQVSDAGEIGAKYRGERVEGSLALYWMSVKDEILFDPFNFTNQNLDRVRHRGVEASLSVQILEWLFAYGNYTFDDVKVVDADDPLVDGARMPITPRHRGTLGVFAALPYDLEFGADVNVVGDRIRANDFDRQVGKIDDYASLDLLFAWRPRFGEHLEGALTLALRNVTSANYEDFGSRDDFDPLTGALEPTAFFFPAAKRTWEVGLMFTVRP